MPASLAAELPSLWVTVPERAPLPGYVCLVARWHVVEPSELPRDERRRFWQDVDTVAELLSRHLQPAKLSYEIHGSTIRHLHLHLFPRTEGDRFDGGPSMDETLCHAPTKTGRGCTMRSPNWGAAQQRRSS